ncbi:kinesin-domain-containing protein [Coccomyxa subellipsoidea C-169]|uniref:Kinesin-like protein n=1 Tax=Coccomyxa subellipsoidea (strain C-169) TaxID=574566 RepID=I0YW96_COCSC|nr:kinesin-domain-containing protein [Coccomyxa subellipsoidea C-169]EIE22665.1 kinesin-domain-containing protein [Coccomyxa subellipsoidea C-169]|eukprot:XP_005647209.1 kinesin-domain-containing protein [Coccomyxa subellipsoidea C-169]
MFQVLREDASQADVFQAAVQPIVADVLNGYNGTIMAYGQTGAGKTYTLSSIAPDAIGMMPRAASVVFSEIAGDPDNTYTVVMSYIQIYMELLQDLLQPQNNDLQIREGEDGVFVAGVHEVEVKNMEDCLHLLQIGDRNRVFAFTALNAHSSRSHAIVMLTIMKRPNAAPQNRALGQKVKVGKLFLVDLAGSERLKKSRSTGLRASEAVSINLSLTTLGMCINARADPNATHVPFRDSKLTRLLQESLGGNAKTSLVIAVANALQHVDETLQSLQFGSRAMRAVVNEHTDFKVINAELVAALDKREDKSHLLEATLLAKEEELEALGSLQQVLILIVRCYG